MELYSALEYFNINLHTVMSHHQHQDEIIIQKPSLSREFLASLFKLSGINDGSSFQKLLRIGGQEGIASQLSINLGRGLESEERIAELREEFGDNTATESNLSSLWDLVKECLEDTMLQILLVAAVFSTGVGILQDGLRTGWTEGATIFLAVFLIVSITAGNNYIKERQFEKLKKKLEESWAQVLRFGKVVQVPVGEIVVGDIVYFSLGDIVSVDGILIQGSEVKTDESAMTGETDQIYKLTVRELMAFSQSSLQVQSKKQSPFLISGTKVDDGTGQMLVLAVGEHTVQGQLRALLEMDNPPTPLQQKLESVAEDIGKLGTVVAVLTFVALIIHLGVSCVLKELQFLSYECLQTVIQAFMIAVTIIVVAVPEGLPLAVTIALAYSVNKMKNEQNLVKNLASCEIMGGANNICSDKTGTLTENLMTVVGLWVENQIFMNQSLHSKQSYITRHTYDLLAEAIGYNTSAFPEKKDGRLVHNGNKTECALIEFLANQGYELDNYRPSADILRVIPFNSKRKKMITLVYCPKKQSLKIFAKGASEQIVLSSTKLVGSNGIEYQLDQSLKNQIKTNVIEKFASHSLRTIGIAYREIGGVGSISQAKLQAMNLKEEDLDKDITLIAITGIKDPIRKEVPQAIKQCNKSGIKVRMVTGDNVITAVSIAKECGILGQDYLPSGNNEVLDGKKFRELVGGMRKIKQTDGSTIMKVNNQEMFNAISKDLKVLARAAPEDKYILVTGLQEQGNVVAVTGDGTNDAPALKKADVGFAMGIAGSDTAKDAADIILMDDNFSSIITACKWGRNIYNCIRKFIQFQLTVNVVALFMSILGAIVLKQSPLNAIQMLWVNLIMDTFASLALATEPPSRKVLNSLPYGRDDPIVTATMYRIIVGQSIYQIIVLVFVLFYLPHVMDTSIPPEYAQYKLKGDIVQMTIFFNTFVLMQVFNSISSRNLDFKVLNPFQNLFNNPMFWVIQVITVLVQVGLIEFGGQFVQVIRLSWKQHLLCLGLGSLGLVVGVLVKLLPEAVCQKMSLFKEKKIEEDAMDQTLTSKLRRKSTVRLHTSKKLVSQSSERKRSSVYLASSSIRS